MDIKSGMWPIFMHMLGDFITLHYFDAIVNKNELFVIWNLSLLKTKSKFILVHN
ncbi:hypothetical protein LL065_25700 (plasmid) [Clostridium estertheticum]|uniref:hypothetical protein n=1 Tax=Clostridium estertheticum TaxID=238834 RepID=UPI00227ACDA1|nr:hypothetical protein [Clostridium estertheticum]WAG43893.1 hypothetical protein LL065_25700 [Clostridium estertheticum]